jgi:hypothetical protein
MAAGQQPQMVPATAPFGYARPSSIPSHPNLPLYWAAEGSVPRPTPSQPPPKWQGYSLAISATPY